MILEPIVRGCSTAAFQDIECPACPDSFIPWGFQYVSAWAKCLQLLERELSEQQLNTWIRPLQVIEEANALRLLAPNRFVLDWVEKNFLEQIRRIAHQISGDQAFKLILEIGSQDGWVWVKPI